MLVDKLFRVFRIDETDRPLRVEYLHMSKLKSCDWLACMVVTPSAQHLQRLPPTRELP